jgi:7,8-dihydro-6-hydroxymethylpterin dimethyltransferase
VQVVLSLDTLDPDKSRIIHGKDITKAKLKCLATLEELDIPTTLLPVCIKGVNEDDVAQIVHDYFDKPFVRSITVQNMTFTGEHGSVFEPREHITLDEVEELLASRGRIAQSDFFPLSAYHPLCYSAAYYLVRDGQMISLSTLFERELLAELTAGSYFIDPKRDVSAEFRDGINRLWVAGADDATLDVLRGFLNEMYPTRSALSEPERRARLERWVKMILIHPHMDRDNFDIDRVSSCGDLVPDEAGQMVPACAYNLLYRQKDPRFWVATS